MMLLMISVQVRRVVGWADWDGVHPRQSRISQVCVQKNSSDARPLESRRFPCQHRDSIVTLDDAMSEHDPGVFAEEESAASSVPGVGARMSQAPPPAGWIKHVFHSVRGIGEAQVEIESTLGVVVAGRGAMSAAGCGRARALAGCRDIGPTGNAMAGSLRLARAGPAVGAAREPQAKEAARRLGARLLGRALRGGRARHPRRVAHGPRAIAVGDGHGGASCLGPVSGPA